VVVVSVKETAGGSVAVIEVGIGGAA